MSPVPLFYHYGFELAKIATLILAISTLNEQVSNPFIVMYFAAAKVDLATIVT